MKNIFKILILSFILTGCAEDLTTNKINFNQNSKTFVNFENKKFPKNSIGNILKLKDARKFCAENSITFYGYAKCFTSNDVLSSYQNYNLDLTLVDYLNSVLFINSALYNLGVINDQKAFDNFDMFIYSSNFAKPKDNDLMKIKNFVDCNTKENFSTFINCLYSDFRSWQLYQNTGVKEKIILEFIVGYSLIFNNKKKINLSEVLVWKDKIDARYAHKIEDDIIDPIYKHNKTKKMYFLEDDKDGYIFLEKLIDFYGSENFLQELERQDEKNRKYQAQQKVKYKSLGFWEKLDYWDGNKNFQNSMKFAEAAINIYTAYRLISFFHQGNVPSSSTSQNSNTTFTFTNDSTCRFFSMCTGYGKNLFYKAPPNSILHKRWLQIGNIRGIF